MNLNIIEFLQYANFGILFDRDQKKQVEEWKRNHR